MSIRRDVLRKYKDAVNVFVETGSYMGLTTGMASWLGFEKIYTVELSEHWYNYCLKQFASDKKVHCLFGDSVEKLPEILEQIDEPAVFWLDGHWSDGDTARGNQDVPLYDELDIIAKHHIKNHILLIDDVRLMGSAEWPEILLETVKKKCLQINDKYVFSFENGYVKDDILVAKL